MIDREPFRKAKELGRRSLDRSNRFPRSHQSPHGQKNLDVAIGGKGCSHASTVWYSLEALEATVASAFIIFVELTCSAGIGSS